MSKPFRAGAAPVGRAQIVRNYHPGPKRSKWTNHTIMKFSIVMSAAIACENTLMSACKFAFYTAARRQQSAPFSSDKMPARE